VGLVTLGTVSRVERRVSNGALLPLGDPIVAFPAQIDAVAEQEMGVISPVRGVTVDAPAVGNRAVHVLSLQALGDLGVTASAQRTWPIEQQSGEAGNVRIVTGAALGLGRRRVLHARAPGLLQAVVTGTADLSLIDRRRARRSGPEQQDRDEGQQRCREGPPHGQSPSDLSV
jgi:hypothetical protein